MREVVSKTMGTFGIVFQMMFLNLFYRIRMISFFRIKKMYLVDCFKIVYENENSKNAFGCLSENLATMKENDKII